MIIVVEVFPTITGKQMLFSTLWSNLQESVAKWPEVWKFGSGEYLKHSPKLFFPITKTIKRVNDYRICCIKFGLEEQLLAIVFESLPWTALVTMQRNWCHNIFDKVTKVFEFCNCSYIYDLLRFKVLFCVEFLEENDEMLK